MKSKSRKEIVTKVNEWKARASVAVMTAGVGLAPFAANARAGSAEDAVLSIAELVVDIFPLIGVFFVIAGAFKLFMAYRNNQPEEQSSAAKDIVIGAVLIVFRAFAWPAIRSVIM